MTTSVIQAEGLSKRYQRGALASSGLLRDSLARTLRAPWTAFKRNKEQAFWALKDVSLQVREGEVLGLIGRNGSGKTTLLKILSRITRPTEGWAEIHGRVGSLLEVGTGFHPELTGRENTYLSGAILGMGKQEIARKFDEIVSFAELEKFIDTPVKHYSSGMYVRLAFAVAAHLEPEILLVDEVLAVGDIRFQKKCMGKMEDVSKAGRTIIFVSHNTGAIGQLCRRCVWLDNGSITLDGSPEETLAAYVRNITDSTDAKNWERTGTAKARCTSVEIHDSDGRPSNAILMGQDMHIRVAGSAEKGGVQFSLAAQIATFSGTIAMYVYDQVQTFESNSNGEFLIDICLPQLMLMPGSYSIHVWIGLAGQEEFDYVKNAASVDVIQSERIPIMLPIHHQMGLIYGHLNAKQLK
jgi:lipopolysaccharide transport system ATP-binding protein